VADERVSVLKVRTPEGVSFSFQLASPVVRAAAWIVDRATVSAAWSLIAILLRFAGLLGEDFAAGLVTVGYFVVSTGYGIVTEWRWEGQTLGKRLLRIRVVDEHGLGLQLSQVVVRNLLRSVDVLPACYLLGGLTALLNRRGQRLGDIAAATVVIHELPPSAAGLEGLAAAKYNSLRGEQHVIARLRNTTSPALAHAALQAVLRREELEPAARIRLFADFAGHFRSAATLPPELAEGISDEQLVRNAVEVLFGVKAPEK